MPVRYARDSKGRFATTTQQDGKGSRSAKNRADKDRRLKDKAPGKRANRTLRKVLGKRVVSKQEKKSSRKFRRRRG